jgi:pimeloyl-ACP methyl ester carboxylesterase
MQPPPQPAGFGRRRSGWWKRGVIGVLLSLVALAGVGAIYQALATARDRRAFLPPGQRVDVGGHQLHLHCQGEGSPTVILEHGGGGSALGWFLVQPEIARNTRVCAYDRAGLGWSDPGPAPRSGRQIAAELHTLLHNANIPGPYVLAGWSYGGLFVRAYAEQFPEDVAGLVLLDATHPDVWTRTVQGQAQYQNDSRLYAVARVLAWFGLWRLIPNLFTMPPAGLSPQQAGQWRAVYNTTSFWDTVETESRAILDTMTQARQAGNLGDLPVLVVTAGENEGVDGQWTVYQDELTTLSADSVHQVVEGAGHADLWLNPEHSQVSSAAILQLVKAVRMGERLSP